MSAFTLDFSSAGLKKGVYKGFVSFLKTMAAAAIAYLSLRLDNLHVANYVKPEYASTALLVVALIHALFTTVGHWVSTPGTMTLGDGSEIPTA